MSDIGRLTVALYANSAQFVSELNRARQTSSSWAKDVGSAFKTTAKTSVAATTAITAGVVALGYAVKSSLDNIDQLTIAAGNLSIPVEKFGDLAYAAKLANTDIESVSDVIKDISVRVQDAAFSNGGPLVDFFKQINQDAGTWAQMRPDQQFKKFVEEINKMESNQARFWLDEINDSASGLFSSLYGSDAVFSKFIKEAENAGISINAQMAANSNAARVEFDRMLAISSATWTNIVAAASPAIEYVLKGINAWVLESAEAEGGFQSLGTKFTVAMVTAVQTVTHSLFGMLDNLKSEMRDIGSYLGKDWFPVPNAAVFERTLASVKQAMAELQNGGEWVKGIGDVPGYWEMSSEQVKKYNALQIRATQLKTQLQGNTDLSSFDAAISEILTKVTTANSEIKNIAAPKMPTFNGTPPVIPTTDNDKPNTAVTAFQQATTEIQTEWQRRLAVQAAGDQALAVQEGFAYQDRYDRMSEQFQLAYDAAKENQTLQQELENQFWTTRETLAAEHQANLSTIEAEQIAKREEQNQGYWDRYLESMQESLLSMDELAASTINSFSSGMGQAFEDVIFDSNSLGEAFDNLAEGMARSFVNALGQMAGQWLAYQTVQLLVGKTTAAAGASALVVQAQAASLQAGLNAFASTAAIPIVGPAAAPAAMAAALAVTAPMAASISTLALSGMAHSGISEVPNEGTWLLDKGERVYTNDSANKLDQMHNSIMGGTSSGNASVVVNLIEDASRAGSVDQSSDGDITTLDIRVAKLLQSSNTQTSAVMKTRYRSPQYGR